jgi:hypothetical protein
MIAMLLYTLANEIHLDLLLPLLSSDSIRIMNFIYSTIS